MADIIFSENSFDILDITPAIVMSSDLHARPFSGELCPLYIGQIWQEASIS